MQLQTLFAIISLQTTMRGFHLSLLSLAFYHLVLADACQSSSCVYLVPHLHSLLLSQHQCTRFFKILKIWPSANLQSAKIIINYCNYMSSYT